MIKLLVRLNKWYVIPLFFISNNREGGFLNKKIVARALEEGRYMVNTGMTVREMSNVFGISKSTIHKDLRERLFEIDIDLYQKVSSILQYHLDVRHIRGGDATRRKFLEKNAN